MEKIASPQELQAELQNLLRYANGPNPSREKLAADLKGLANRTAATALTEDQFNDLFVDAVSALGRIFKKYKLTVPRAFRIELLHLLESLNKGQL